MRTVFLALAGVFVTAPVHAGTIAVLPAGQIAPLDGNNLVTFDRLVATAYGSTTSAGQFQAGGATFSGNGLIMRNGLNGSLPSLGLYAEPYHDTSNYLAVLGNDSETVSFNSKHTSFGLYWGSIDTYNSIAFYNNGRVIASYAGSDLAPLLPIPFGDQNNDGSNRYVRFGGMGLFDTVVLSSGGNSFELDNITSSVPEASTWMMMLVGFASLAGFKIYLSRFSRSGRMARVNQLLALTSCSAL